MGDGRHHSAYIVIDGPGHDGTRLPLREGITSFGRLPSNDVILLGDLVSRHHSRITFFEGRATLQDLGSHNGSWVNGEQIQSKVLKQADVCRVGNFRVAFNMGRLEDAAFEETTGADVNAGDLTPSGAKASVSLHVEEKAAETSAMRLILRSTEAWGKTDSFVDYIDEMLRIALEQTRAEVGAYITRTNNSTNVVVARDKANRVARPHIYVPVVDWALQKNFPISSDDVSQDFRFGQHPSQIAGKLSVLAVPLANPEGTMGVLFLSRVEPAFSDLELEALTAVGHLAQAGASKFTRGGGDDIPYASPTVIQALERRARDGQTGLETQPAVALRALPFNLGLLAERPPKALPRLLDQWIEQSAQIIERSGGVAHSMNGAEVQGIFRVTDAEGSAAAITAGLELRSVFASLLEAHPTLGDRRLRLGADAGAVALGAVGGPGRFAYAAIGEPVDIAARLCFSAPAGVFLVSGELAHHIQGRFTLKARGEQKVRGREGPLALHEVIGSK